MKMKTEEKVSVRDQKLGADPNCGDCEFPAET